MDLDAYLKHIGYTGPLDPTTETLAQLHRAHLLSIPFENLDIFLGRPIVLDIQSFYDKVIGQGRGGYCYELNGLFQWLLTTLGFTVKMLSARVYDNGSPNHEFDHMLLLVETEKPLIADVGFGDSFIEPIGFDQKESCQRKYFYRLTQSDSRWMLSRRDLESNRTIQYDFSLIPRELEAFAGMNKYHQTSADSIFTRKRVCTKATTDGRITLSKNRLIRTCRENRKEEVVTGEADFLAKLKEHFGIDLSRSLSDNLW